MCNWTCAMLAIHSASIPEHCLTLADQWRGRTVIAHHHHLDVDCLRADHLIRILSRLWPQISAMQTLQQRFSRRCSVAIALGSSHTIFQSLFERESAVREYLKKRDRSVEKNPPWATPTPQQSTCTILFTALGRTTGSSRACLLSSLKNCLWCKACSQYEL